MSKCDFAIQFERPDRTYRPGEAIRGTATVEVNRDFSCDRVVIEHFWKTHGKGNTTEGPKDEREFPATAFRAGFRQQFPFEFTAPEGPPTYHGTYLNVDHYIRIYADVPWAIDPKHEEDYVLAPGSQPWGWLPSGTSAKITPGPIAGWIGLLVAIIFTAIFSMVMLPCAIIPGLIAAGVLFSLLRKPLATKRLGAVQVEWGTLRTAPGGAVPVRVRIKPPGPVAIGGVTARLLGREICVSGSGTNRSTHTHTFFDQQVPIAASIELPGGRSTELSGSISVPDDARYSFHATDNELKWSIELRVDVPRWPDWIEEVTLEVRPGGEPATALEPPAAAPILIRPAAAGMPSDTMAQEGENDPLADSNSAIAPEALYRPAAAAEPLPGPSLETLARELAAAPRYGSERNSLVAGYLGQVLEGQMVVESINRTFDYVSEEYRNGRTAVGRLSGAELLLAVQFPTVDNDRLDAIAPGESLAIRAVPFKWNIIYDRLEMHSQKQGD